MRQIGKICQALYTEAFTSFCQTYDGAMCALASLSTIAFSLHVVWRTALFSHPLSCALGCICEPSPRSFPSFWLDTAPFSLLHFVATSSFLCPRLLSRPSPRSFPSSWPGTAPLSLLSVVATGTLGHAGGWLLRRKPRVLLLRRLSLSFLNSDVPSEF